MRILGVDPTPARVIPAALLLYLGFMAGGHPPGVTSFAAVLLALWLATRSLTGAVARPSGTAAVAIGALTLLAAWTLASGAWSGAPIRAIFATDRTILYVLVVATMATLPRDGLPHAVVALAGAIVTVGAAALVARLVFGIAPDLSPHRLTWPLTYWNALALLMALGLVLCFHLAASVDVSERVRAAAAVAVPALACALYLTLSRGGFALAAAGLALYAVLARPRGLVAAAATVLPGTVAVLATALLSPALVGVVAPEDVLRWEGRRLGFVLVLAMVATAYLWPRLQPLDGWARRVFPRPSRPVGVALGVAGLTALCGAAVASGAPAELYDRFLGSGEAHYADPRGRLLQLSNSGRVEQWRIALEASRNDRIRGTGAGTFALQWDRLRREPRQVTEAHSLYVETLDELGIVGIVLLGVALCALFAGPLSARRRPRADRVLVAVVAAMWLGHAALEWDWEMPAVTIVPLALAAGAGRAERRLLGARAGAALAVAAGFLAVLPALTALSAPRQAAALRSYEAGDCAAATEQAATARALLDARPQPHLVAGLCAARAGRLAEAVRRGRDAVERDPENWEYHYDLAVLIAAGGGDPTRELDAVKRLSGSPISLEVLGLSSTDATRNRSNAFAARLLIDRIARAPIGAPR